MSLPDYNTGVEKEIERITSLNCELALPGSKSVTARATIMASLAQGVSRIANPAVCEDIDRLNAALRSIGVGIRTVSDSRGSYLEIGGCGGRIPANEGSLFVGDSGTAMRFLTALCALGYGRFRIDGTERMRQRPVGALADALNHLGAQVSAPDSCPPVTVKACGLRGGSVTVDCSQSSQFLSAILLIASYAKERVTLRARDPVSVPYIEMTVSVMNSFGVEVKHPEPGVFTVSPSAYRASDFVVEADASSASYFFAAAAIVPGRVTISNLSLHGLQGDARFIEILRQMGAEVVAKDGRVTVTGTGHLRGIDVDMRDTPDLVPALSVVAPFADSPTTIRAIGHLRLKESDRIESICGGLTRVGAKNESGPDWIKIFPGALRGARIRTRSDHRIALAFSVLGLKVPEIVIDGCECVRKSFPDFYKFLSTL
jgi:3-phosphoshikimate 1-carboxyvinyltransferase